MTACLADNELTEGYSTPVFQVFAGRARVNPNGILAVYLDNAS